MQRLICLSLLIEGWVETVWLAVWPVYCYWGFRISVCVCVYIRTYNMQEGGNMYRGGGKETDKGKEEALFF